MEEEKCYSNTIDKSNVNAKLVLPPSEREESSICNGCFGAAENACLFCGKYNKTIRRE